MNSAWPPSWGGGEKWTVEAAEWFHERGNEVTVIGRPQSKLIAAARGRHLTVREHRFGGDLDPFAIRKARKILQDTRAELAVVNFNKEAWQFGRAALWLKIPVVARHGFPLFRQSRLHKWLAEHILTYLIVNARSIRDQYAEWGFDVSRVTVIHNGVNPLSQREGQLRQRFRIAENDLLILAAGRIEPQKRLDRARTIAAQT